MKDLSLWSNKEPYIQIFKNQTDNFYISPDKNSIKKVCFIIINSKITLNFDIKNENTDLECYCLIPSIENQNIEVNVQTNINANNNNFSMNLYALANNNASITINGNLHITKDTNNINTSLFEETLLVWNAKYISQIPSLKVDSKNIKASHWAKIQRIPAEKLFYMQSRWLETEKSVQIITHSYFQRVFEYIWLNDQEKSKLYSLVK